MSGAGERLPLAEVRRVMGASCRLWVGDGTHIVEDDWWVSLSGVGGVDYNIVCWQGADPPIRDGLELIRKGGVPAVQMLAGPALASAQTLVESEWACIGSLPIMTFDMGTATSWVDEPVVEVVGSESLDGVQAAVRDAFGISQDLARLAVPDLAVTDPAMTLWTLVEDGVLKSCVTTILVDGILVGWSMATPPEFQGQGIGRRLLTTVIGRLGRSGVHRVICAASRPGYPLYVTLGFEVVEHWQMWSRPRWVLSKT
jgi:GNAT superfamily N-acetyltransferase